MRTKSIKSHISRAFSVPVILLCVLLLPAQSSMAESASQLATIQHFYYQQPEDRMQFVFDLDRTIEHKVFRLNNPERVVIDFFATEKGESVSIKAQTHAPLVSLRHAPRSENNYRVVLDLEKKMDIRSFEEKTKTGIRLVVELMKDKAVIKANTKSSINANLKQTRVAAPRDIIIAIDAGHGGKDPGAIGKRGTQEKVIVLKIARELQKQLKKSTGYKPVLIRDTDKFIPLRERMNIARKYKADFFISIHADAAQNRKAKGSSVYTLSATGATSEAAKWLAQKENNADLVGGVRLDNKDDMLASVLLDLSQRHTNESSIVAAKSLLGEMKKVGKVHKDTVEKAGFVVLKSPDIPSVLVESAFLSNPSEEKKLRSKKYQVKLAKAINKGIKAYFKRYAPEGTIIASLRKQEHIIRSGDTLSGIAFLYNVNLKQLRKHNNLRSDAIRIGQRLKIPLDS